MQNVFFKGDLKMYEESKYRPLSPWAYFGYQILFSLPVLGFIFLIIYSLSDKNINRRNFARSYFCVLALLLIVFAVLLVLGIGTSIFDAIRAFFISTYKRI